MKKKLFVVATLIFSSLASAQAVRVGGGGGRPGNMALACTEGQLQPFTEKDVVGRDHVVWRACQDGTYYPRSREVRIFVCSEGSLALFNEQDVSGRNHEVWKVCRHGKYIDP